MQLKKLATSQMCGGSQNHNGNAVTILFLVLCILPLFTTVASVPTSVLAQNSELSTNNKNDKNNNNNHVKSFVSLAKVKRSSNSNKENIYGGNDINTASAASATSTTSPASNGNNSPDKKSSPEIVPASFSNLPPARNPVNADKPNQPIYALPSNSEIMAAVEAAAANQQQHPQYYGSDDDDLAAVDALPTSAMHKRGISSQQYLYDAALNGGPYLSGSSNLDYYGNAPYGQNVGSYGVDVPNGVWTDDIESAPIGTYADLQDLDDYVPVQRASTNNRNKAYDNLQNLLNTEAYLESVPVSVPLQYSTRNYGVYDADRNKRGGYYNPSGSNKFNNKYGGSEMRNHKRDNTKLTPADMLALVALVEAGERARKETDADAGYAYPGDNYAPKSYTSNTGSNTGNVYDYGALGASTGAALEDMDYSGNVGAAAGNWLDAPAVVDYYGVPMNVETVPKYEFIPREHKYAAGNGGNSNNRAYGSTKRFMVAKKKRSIAKYLNNGEKFY